MHTEEDINNQVNLLKIYRYTVYTYKQQLAILGKAHAPPGVFYGIHDACDNITRIKNILKNWGREAEDHPDDEYQVELWPPFDSNNFNSQVRNNKSNELIIDKLIQSLKHDKGFESVDGGRFIFDFIGITKSMPLAINAFALVRADSLSEMAITGLHLGFFSVLEQWRPQSNTHRGAMKNGLLCFLFEKSAAAEKILTVLQQKRKMSPIISDTRQALDTAVTVSWVLDANRGQVYTHDIINESGIVVSKFPPVFLLPSMVYPGKEYLEKFLLNYIR